MQDHLDRREPFIVRFDTPIIDYGAYEIVYAGLEVEGAWTIHQIVERSTSHFETFVDSSRCDDLIARPACTDETSLFSDLCFQCTEPAETDRCRVR